MSDVHHRPRKGKGSDPSEALDCLDRFIEAAKALESAWDPVLDRLSYPTCLPSFDEFVSALYWWRDDTDRIDDADGKPVKRLDLDDPDEVRTWLVALRTQIDDLGAAGEDTTRPLGQRKLGRVVARRRVREAYGALLSLLRAAEHLTA